MYAIIKSILCMIIPAMMQLAAVGSVQVTPETAATAFLDGLAKGEDTVVLKYVDNEYVNMLENTGGKETSEELYKNLFHNFSYEIVDSAAKGDVAVVKMVITNNDFSKVRKKYDEKAYNYITSNLYEEGIEDKKKLSKKCLDIYVDAIEDASESKKLKEKTIFLPLKSNGFYGWEVLINDKIMKDILGGLVIPGSK